MRIFSYIGKVSTTFLAEDIEISWNFLLADRKIGFSTISLKPSTFGHMLLHKSYINVAIANIFLYRKSLYDLPGRKYKIPKKSKGRGQKGRGSSKCHSGENVYPSQFVHLWPNRVKNVEKSSGPRDLSRIFARCQINRQY